MNEVYQKGYTTAESEFWDAFQDNGKRTDYSYAFAESKSHAFWSKGFTPKYPIKVTTMNSLDGAFINFGK